MGYLSSRNWLYRVWNRLNQWTFQKASIIFALSNGMVKELLTSLPAGAIIQEEIQVIPPWANTKTVYPVPPRENQFMEEAGLTGRFVVLYSGNMGITHPLETLIEAARHLHSFPNIQFLMVGDGPKRIGLQHQAEGLKNLKFLPFLSDHDFNQCLSASSIVVVMLQIKAAVVSVPSKTYNALAAGKPLLVLAGSKAEISRLVDKYQVGVRVDTNDPLALARLIQELSERPDYTKMLSKNALDLSYSFTPKLADKLVETWLSK
jgi:glycosyltransferase involved in cell wall biosynthesis